jgi:FMN phosphatase YigB (HAD superfamily)
VAVSWVVFDVGETLVDETRHWEVWADALGIPHFTFLATLGGVIARGDEHRRVFELLRPDLNVDDLLAQRNGDIPPLGPSDFYPDALPALRALRELGYRIGVAGNTTTEMEDAMRSADFEFDLVASSERWQVWKPSSLFFARIAEECACEPGEIAYVGDRVDNDVVPAATAGMAAVFLVRGPWAVLHRTRPEAFVAKARIESLAELPEVLARV